MFPNITNISVVKCVIICVFAIYQNKPLLLIFETNFLLCQAVIQTETPSYFSPMIAINYLPKLPTDIRIC